MLRDVLDELRGEIVRDGARGADDDPRRETTATFLRNQTRMRQVVHAVPGGRDGLAVDICLQTVMDRRTALLQRQDTVLSARNEERVKQDGRIGRNGAVNGHRRAHTHLAPSTTLNHSIQEDTS